MEDPIHARQYQHLINQIQTSTRLAKDRDKSHLSCYWSPPNDDNMLLHHDLLLPHWREFSNALDERNPNSLTLELFIDGIHLPEVVVDILFPSLAKHKLRKLALYKNNLGSGGIAAIAKLLTKNTLTDLDLTGNRFDDLDAVTSFADALKDHSLLNYVRFHNCGLGERTDCLRVVLHALRNKALFLYLNGNQLSSEGAGEIASFLASDSHLLTLFVDNNQFRDEDAPCLAEGLKQNSTLRSIYFENNQFTELGDELLIRSIFDDSSLNAIVDCNHTCELNIGKTLRYNNNSYVDGKSNVKNKLFLALRQPTLGSGPMKLDYFRGVPVELMPHVLHMLQRNPRERGNCHLTKTLDVMRYWIVPSLAEMEEANDRTRLSSSMVNVILQCLRLKNMSGETKVIVVVSFGILLVALVIGERSFRSLFGMLI